MAIDEESRIEAFARWCLGRIRWCLSLAITTSVLILIAMINFKPADDWHILVATGFFDHVPCATWARCGLRVPHLHEEALSDW
jgi:hypothetical protein